MAVRDFLLEIGSEELPSAPLDAATEQLGKLFEEGLAELGLGHGEIQVLSGPRRLAVYVHDLEEATQAIHQELRGPACEIAFDESGAPTKAAEGFARGKGLTAADLEVRADKDGRDYVWAVVDTPAREAAELMGPLSERILHDLSWPKSQRWGRTHERWCRPIRWILCLFGDEVLPVQFAGFTSSSVTYTHRVLGSGAVEVPLPQHYETILAHGYVLSHDKRVEAIMEGIAKVEADRPGSHVDLPRATFNEVVNLCEWPTVLVGRFDEEFLAVPHEIICESMLSHQRYFPIYDAQGQLTNEFVIVSNGDPEVSATVVDGNERVVRARLYDAKFFYDEDLKVPMEDMLEQLGQITFQEKLGTVLQKVERLESNALELARACGFDARVSANAVRAAHLAKADLVSQAVIEFTSQQGVMGGYYAAAAGEDPDVCDAVRDHYRPRFAGDELPAGDVGKIVAVADKLDTICGMFAIDEPPTGSSDPYAVRRAAIGVIALLRELPQADLSALIRHALSTYAEQGIAFDMDEVASKVEGFFQGRLVQIAKGEGAPQDAIDAVNSTGIVTPTEFLQRVSALDEARKQNPDVFEDLSIAFGRAANLGDAKLGEDVDESILDSAEKVLLDACVAGKDKVAEALAQGSYENALAALASLRAPIDSFFEKVLVMDEDESLRNNRLRLLNKFVSVFREVADIGALSRKS